MPVMQSRPVESSATINQQKTIAPLVIRDKTENECSAVISDKSIKSPSDKRQVRPPRKPGYIWQSHGPGWDCRRDERVNGKGKRPYVAHLSRSEFDRLKRLYKTEKALASALEDWIAGKENSK